MNKRPGHVKVTIETGYCSFCDRTRNLRREERQLGALIRTVIACESCHRLLSSSMGVAGVEPPTEPETAAALAPSDGATPAETETERPAAKPKSSVPKAKTAASKTTKGRAPRRQ